MRFFIVYRKPPALLVVPKSFSFAQFPPQRKAPLCKGSCQRSWLRGCTREKSEKTIPPSRQAVPPPFTQGRLKNSCHICGSGATSASGGSFDEPIGSACEMPQGGLCKPPARLVVMTCNLFFVEETFLKESFFQRPFQRISNEILLCFVFLLLKKML